MNLLEKNDRALVDPYYKESFSRCPHPYEDSTALLKCSNPSSVVIPAVTAAVTSTTTTIASLSISTRHIYDPKIKLDFSAYITVPIAALALSLSFQIYKVSSLSGLRIPVGPSILFSRAASLVGSTPIAFTACDCDSCDEPCTLYTVDVTNTSAIALIGLSINNSILSTTIVGTPIKGIR